MLVRRILPFGLTGAGLLGGHTLAYLAAVPVAGDRAELLHRTGHGYLPRALLVAAVVAVMAAGAAALRGYARGALGAGVAPGYRATAARIAALQLIGFALLETGERLAAGAPLGDLPGPLFVAGLLVQILVAAAVAVILVLVDRAGEVVGRTFRLRPERTAGVANRPTGSRSLGPRRRPGRPISPRGPPAPLTHPV